MIITELNLAADYRRDDLPNWFQPDVYFALSGPPTLFSREDGLIFTIKLGENEYTDPIGPRKVIGSINLIKPDAVPIFTSELEPGNYPVYCGKLLGLQTDRREILSIKYHEIERFTVEDNGNFVYLSSVCGPCIIKKTNNEIDMKNDRFSGSTNLPPSVKGKSLVELANDSLFRDTLKDLANYMIN